MREPTLSECLRHFASELPDVNLTAYRKLMREAADALDACVAQTPRAMTCATCRHYGQRKIMGKTLTDPACNHPRSPLLAFAFMPNGWGCTLHAPVDLVVGEKG